MQKVSLEFQEISVSIFIITFEKRSSQWFLLHETLDFLIGEMTVFKNWKVGGNEDASLTLGEGGRKVKDLLKIKHIVH